MRTFPRDSKFKVERLSGRLDASVDQIDIEIRVASRWREGVSFEFIELADLKRVGSRQKFRHLVTNDDSGTVQA